MEPVPPNGVILYDGECGFCRRWAPYWEETLRKRGIAIAPLQSPWVKERLKLPEEELMRDMRLLLPDGSQKIGADAYRHALRLIWWAWPLYFFSIIPGGRHLFNWGYKTFARNRYRVSKTCQL